MSKPDLTVQGHDANEQPQPRPYAEYAFLITLYNALFGLFIWAYRRKQEPLESISALDLVTLGLATLRISKAISEDEITRVVREPVVEVVDGERRPAGEGLRWSLGKLILCPTCIGTWIAAFLTYALHLYPRYTRPFLAVMSASGLSQFSDALLCLVYTDRDLRRKQQPN